MMNGLIIEIPITKNKAKVSRSQRIRYFTDNYLLEAILLRHVFYIHHPVHTLLQLEWCNIIIAVLLHPERHLTVIVRQMNTHNRER